MLSAWNADLCDSCIELDFEDIFMTADIPKEGLAITTIKSHRRRNEARNCRLCRFLLQAKTAYRKNYSQHVRLYTLPGRPDDIVCAETPRQPFLSVFRKQSKSWYQCYTGFVKEEVVQNGLIGYVSGCDTRSSHIREVGPNVMYQELQARVECCLRRH